MFTQGVAKRSPWAGIRQAVGLKTSVSNSTAIRQAVGLKTSVSNPTANSIETFKGGEIQSCQDQLSGDFSHQRCPDTFEFPAMADPQFRPNSPRLPIA